MKQLSKNLALLVLFLLSGLQVFSYDFEVNGIYYGYDSNNQTAYVTYNYSQKYTGDVKIPTSISYNGKTIKVTAIGERAFLNCTELTSIIIPNTIKEIREYAFSGCSMISNLAIPSSVTSIEAQALPPNMDKLVFIDGEDGLHIYYWGNTFGRITYLGRNLYSEVILSSDRLDILSIAPHVKKIPYENVNKQIFCLSNQPSLINCEFNNNTYLHTQLYVPISTKQQFLVAEGWKNFFNIQEMDVADMWNGQGEPSIGDTPQRQKCEKPSIHYSKSKLSFECATDGATCQSTITDTDIASYSVNEIQLSATYNISVYASKEGFDNSDVATATLCWIDVDPKTEGIESGVAQVNANAVLIQSHDGTVSVEGVADGTDITIYDTSGQMVGSTKAHCNYTTIATNLRNGSVAIVRIGDKSLKITMK